MAEASPQNWRPVPAFPDVVLSHPAKPGGAHAMAARNTTISVGGVDLTYAVTDFQITGAVKDAVVLHLTLLCGSVEWLAGPQDDDPARDAC